MRIFGPFCPSVTKMRYAEIGQSSFGSRRKRERRSNRLRKCTPGSGTRTDRQNANEKRWRLPSRLRETERCSRYLNPTSQGECPCDYYVDCLYVL